MMYVLLSLRRAAMLCLCCAVLQALKFSPDGQLLMQLGTEKEPGSDNTHFCKPTQVSQG